MVSSLSKILLNLSLFVISLESSSSQYLETLTNFLHTSSSNQYLEKVANFLNATKDLQPVAKSGALVFKVTNPSNKNTVSYLIGSFHNGKIENLGWNFMDFAKKCSVLWSENPNYQQGHIDGELQLTWQEFWDQKQNFLDPWCYESKNFVNANSCEEEKLEKLHNFEQNLTTEEYLHCAFFSKYGIAQNLDHIMMQFNTLAYIYGDVQTSEDAIKLTDMLLAPRHKEIIANHVKKSLTRNKEWIKIKELLKDLRSTNTLILVGYDHLYGKEGLVNLLKEKGFQIEQAEIQLKHNFTQQKYDQNIQEIQNQVIKLCQNAFPGSKIPVEIKNVGMAEEKKHFRYLNGKRGTIIGFMEGPENRFAVDVDNKQWKFKKENLTFKF